MKLQAVLPATCLALILVFTEIHAQTSSPEGSANTPQHTQTDNHSTNDKDSGTDNHSSSLTVVWSVILTVVTVLLILITAGVVYAVRRARYGAFCCISAPRMTYKLESNISESDFDFSEDATDQQPPPAYESTCSSTLSPPAYCDALQDVVLQRGGRRCHGNPLVYTTTLLTPPPYTAVPGGGGRAVDEGDSSTPLIDGGRANPTGITQGDSVVESAAPSSESQLQATGATEGETEGISSGALQLRVHSAIEGESEGMSPRALQVEDQQLQAGLPERVAGVQGVSEQRKHEDVGYCSFEDTNGSTLLVVANNL